jgi:hypothetical protein
MRAVLLSAVFLALWQGPALAQPISTNAAPQQNTADSGSTGNLDALIASAAREPTDVILEMSLRLFQNGRQDDGVFWYYVGQLRGRMEAETNSNAAETYGAVFATMGSAINEYAFGDVEKLAATMDRVLAWDDAHPFERIDPAVRTKQRAGLTQLRAYVLAHRDEIHKSRAASGLPNAQN